MLGHVIRVWQSFLLQLRWYAGSVRWWYVHRPPTFRKCKQILTFPIDTVKEGLCLLSLIQQDGHRNTRANNNGRPDNTPYFISPLSKTWLFTFSQWRKKISRIAYLQTEAATIKKLKRCSASRNKRKQMTDGFDARVRGSAVVSVICIDRCPFAAGGSPRHRACWCRPTMMDNLTQRINNWTTLLIWWAAHLLKIYYKYHCQ